TTYGIMTFIQTKKALPQEEESPDIRKLGKSDYLGLALKGFLLNFINVGVLGFWLGLIIVFGPQLEMDPNRLLVFFTTVISTYFIIDLLKILLAKRLNHKLTPTRIYRLKRGISIVIIVFGLVLVSRGIFPSELEELESKVEHVIPKSDNDES
uniref:LysE family translocator n=1 Tax=Mesonia mobilis TaxID=369791 RepID=UPI0026F22A5B